MREPKRVRPLGHVPITGLDCWHCYGTCDTQNSHSSPGTHRFSTRASLIPIEERMPENVNAHNIADMVTAQVLADRAGERYSTVDYWATSSLLLFVRRGNRRYFDLELNLERCQKIREMQNSGDEPERNS